MFERMRWIDVAGCLDQVDRLSPTSSYKSDGSGWAHCQGCGSDSADDSDPSDGSVSSNNINGSRT